jgi:hypothetical protein
MEKKEILLPTKRYFKAEEQDLNLNVKLENDETLLRQGDKDIVLNLADLFNEERNKSINYKIYGKIKMVFRNMYSGNTNYTPLLRNLYLSGDGTGSDVGFVPYNEFAFLRNDVVREKTVPKTGSTLGYQTVVPDVSLDTGVPFGRYTGHTTMSSLDAPYKNWNLYLSYIHSHDTGFTMNYTLSGGTNYNFVSGNGIPFRVESNGNYYTLTSPVEHGMSAGEYIILSGGTYTTYSGNTKASRTFYTIPITQSTEQYRAFYIDNVGNEIYNSEKYVINILKNELTSGTTFSSVVLGRRCTDIKDITGSTSTYYVHKHKTLTTIDDYILDKVGFESSVWEDERKILFENTLQENDVLVERNRQESLLFDFKNTFSLSGITNNLGYTPTEVYVTTIFRNSNGLFDYPPKVGFKFNFHGAESPTGENIGWIDNQFSGTTSIEKAMSGLTQTFNGKEITLLNKTYNYTGTTFTGGTSIPLNTTGITGAFVEYNRKELKERIISETFHKFSHRTIFSGTTVGNDNKLFYHSQDQSSFYSGASSSNPVGYYYQPHYRVKLRELSPYIETSKLDAKQPNTLINLPENAIYDEKEKLWKWRDLYDHGFIDQEGNGTNFPFINNTHYVTKNINFYLRNEKSNTNKQDGLTGFDNYRNKTNC